MITKNNKPDIIKRRLVLQHVGDHVARAQDTRAQDAVKVVDLVSPTNIQTNETITMDKKNVDVPEKPSTTVTEEKANTTEEHKKQVDEEVNDDMIIDTKKSNNATEQPTKELQEPAKGN